MYPGKENPSFGIFVKNQVDALKQRNLQMDVLAITNPKSGKVNVIKKYFIWFFRAILILLTKGKKYQVIHAHYVFPSGYIGLLFKRLHKSRLIVTAHGGDLDKMAKKSPKLLKLTTTILQSADHVIAVGDQLYHQIVTDYSVNEQNVSILNMGVNRHIFKPVDKQLAKEQCGLTGEAPIILFVGNLIEQKGLLDLIDAMVILQSEETNGQLYLIGADKDPAFKKRLEHKIMEEHLQKRVRFLGIKEQAEIATWMCAADCLVLPSHIEGFGLVALEAMSCGTPVIGTNVGGLRYLLAKGAGEITPVLNPEALAKSILNVLYSKEKRNLLIKNGNKKAEENDQERIINRLMEVYFPTGG
ncbi:glycosyltransferase [Bacillus sp. EB600]|nr:glycosyltransferase [Bacillus sp. EB600]